MLQAEMMDGGKVNGFIGFDDCFHNCLWTKEQIDILSYASKLLSIFLYKYRRQQELEITNAALTNNIRILKNEHQKLLDSEKKFDLVMGKLSLSYWEYDIIKNRISETSSWKRLHGGCDITNIPESMISCGFFNPESAERLRNMYDKLRDGEPYVDGIFQVKNQSGDGWIYERVQYTTIFDNENKPYKAVAISSDVTKEKEEGDRLQAIIDSVPGGIGIFEVLGNKLRLLYLNNSFFDIIGGAMDKRIELAEYDYMSIIHPEDYEMVKEKIDGVLNGKNSVDFRFKMKNYSGGYSWLRVVGKRKWGRYGDSLVYCSFVAVDKYMANLIELQKTQALVDVALSMSKSSLWEYDVKTHTAILTIGAQRHHGLEKYIYNLPESLIEKGYVHEDSVDDYRTLFSGNFPDNKPVQYDIKVKSLNNKDYVWERYIITPVYNTEGELITSYGSSTDITEQKRLIEGYQKQVFDLEQLSSGNLIAKGRYNLTKDTNEYYSRESDDAVSKKDILHYDKGMISSANLCCSEDEKQKFLKVFDRQTLIDNYAMGKKETSLKYKRYSKDGGILWCMTQGNLFEDPNTGDIMCFICSFDITEQMAIQNMIDSVVNLDYEFIAMLNLNTQKYTVYKNNNTNGTVFPDFYSIGFEKEVTKYAKTYLQGDDAISYINSMKIEKIREELSKQEKYIFYESPKIKSGEFCKKMMQSTYLDKNAETILISRVDVTEISRLEEQKVEALQAAKDAAEKANQAKVDFFSQMSHDLRTPLNAILGLTEIAKSENTSESDIRKYLSNIYASGQYLLGIVNDGLDIEKISAGKMALYPTPYSFYEFCENIYIMIEPIAKNKGVELRFYNE